MSSFKKTALAVVLLLILGIGAYFLATSEYFKGIIARLDPSKLQMHNVRDSVTVRQICPEGEEEFCTWPIETKKETSFNVEKDAVFEILPKPDGAPSGTLRALKADFSVFSITETGYNLKDNSVAANTEIKGWCARRYNYSGDTELGLPIISYSTASVHCSPIPEHFAGLRMEKDYSVEVEYTVRDAAGRSDSVTKTVVIPAKEPEIVAVCRETQGAKKTEWTFSGDLKYEDGTSFPHYDPGDYTWMWDFGDDTAVKRGQSVTHNYIPGVYNPTLFVPDKETNRYETSCAQITVIQPGPALQAVPGPSASGSTGGTTGPIPDTGTSSIEASAAPTEMEVVDDSDSQNYPTPADQPAAGRGSVLHAATILNNSASKTRENFDFGILANPNREPIINTPTITDSTTPSEEIYPIVYDGDEVTTATELEPAVSPDLVFLNESKTKLVARAGATVYFEADCLNLAQALKIFPLNLQSVDSIVKEEKTVEANLLLQYMLHDTALNTVRKIGSNTGSNPGAGLMRKDIRVTTGGMQGVNLDDLSGSIERPTNFGIVEDPNRGARGATAAPVVAVLGIKGENLCPATPVEPETPACKNAGESLGTPEDVCCEGLVVGPDDYNDAASWGRCQVPQPIVPQPITPVCKVDKNIILTGEDIIFTGRDSTGPYTDATLDFGDGTTIELNVPAAESTTDTNTPALTGRERPARFNNFRSAGEFAGRIHSAGRIPIEKSLAREREVPPVINISPADIDQVQTFHPHTYSAAGTFSITLTLNDTAGQAYTCNQTVTVVDPVPPTADNPPTPPQCADGLDNDGDGFTDFIVGAGDPGCEDAADNDETNPQETIADEPTDDEAPRLPFCLAYSTPEKYIDVSPQHRYFDIIKEESSTAYNGAYDDFVGQAIFHGYKSKNNKRIFKPQQGILRSEAAKIIMHATCYADALLEYGLLDATDVPFKDVPADHWADQIINILSNAGIFDADLEYNNPNSHTTRAEFIKLLVEVHVQTIGDELHAFRPEDNPFVDVEADAWYAPYIQTAVDYGIVPESPDFKFNPDRFVTREVAAGWIDYYFRAVADATFEEKRQGQIEAALDEEEGESVLPPIAR